MMLTESELQRRRSPADLRAFAERVVEWVRSSRDEFANGMTRRGLYKEFLDEILPLSHFAVVAYPSTYSVEPVLGNQGYDVMVYDDAGSEVDRLELTRPHDGRASAEDARLVVRDGIGAFRIGDPGSEIEELLPHVLQTARAKAQKDYGGCTLVIVLGIQPPIAGFEAVHEARVQQIVSGVSEIHFRARRVVLFVPPNRIVAIGASVAGT
jgi:hypothetical protein